MRFAPLVARKKLARITKRLRLPSRKVGSEFRVQISTSPVQVSERSRRRSCNDFQRACARYRDEVCVYAILSSYRRLTLKRGPKPGVGCRHESTWGSSARTDGRTDGHRGTGAGAGTARAQARTHTQARTDAVKTPKKVRGRSRVASAFDIHRTVPSSAHTNARTHARSHTCARAIRVLARMPSHASMRTCLDTRVGTYLQMSTHTPMHRTAAEKRTSG